MSEPSLPDDRVLRAMTDDGSFRVIAVRTTQTVRGAIAAQKPHGEIAHAYADLLTASILVRELMAPDHRMQLMLEADATRSRLVADAHPGGMTRGLVQVAPGTVAFPFGPGARLTAMRSLKNGAIQQGTVEVPANGGVAGGLMTYLLQSEQVLCAIAVGTLLDGDLVRASGGYVVQLLPETSHEALALMTNRLQGLAQIEHLLEGDHADPAALLTDILRDIPYTRVADASVHFGCLCSEERVMTSLSTLPKKDVEEILAAGEVLEIACEYCGKQYKIEPQRLIALRDVN